MGSHRRNVTVDVVKGFKVVEFFVVLTVRKGIGFAENLYNRIHSSVYRILYRGDQVPTCSWCGATEGLTAVNAYEYGITDSINVCINVAKCNDRYWKQD